MQGSDVPAANDWQLVVRWLQRISRRLRRLERQGPPREHHDVESFAKAVRRQPFTVRMWCLRGRISATKGNDGRSWRIAASELDRYQKEGLLPERDR